MTIEYSQGRREESFGSYMNWFIIAQTKNPTQTKETNCPSYILKLQQGIFPKEIKNLKFSY